MKKILRLFGYKEKTLEIREALQEVCETRIIAEEKMEKLRMTLDGEDFWFSRGAEDANNKTVDG